MATHFASFCNCKQISGPAHARDRARVLDLFADKVSKMLCGRRTQTPLERGPNEPGAEYNVYIYIGFDTQGAMSERVRCTFMRTPAMRFSARARA